MEKNLKNGKKKKKKKMNLPFTMILSKQLACFFDTGCRAKNDTACKPGFSTASNLVPHDGIDRTLRNQSRSVMG